MTDRCAVEAAELPPPLPPELRRAESRPQLGVMLLRDGHLTMEQLEAALAEKESGGARLGEILVAHGWVSGAVVARALAEQHGLEFVDLVHVDVDPSALSLLPEKLARRYEALPIRFLDEATVLIAVADPTNVLASDDLRLALGLLLPARRQGGGQAPAVPEGVRHGPKEHAVGREDLDHPLSEHPPEGPTDRDASAAVHPRDVSHEGGMCGQYLRIAHGWANRFRDAWRCGPIPSRSCRRKAWDVAYIGEALFRT